MIKISGDRVKDDKRKWDFKDLKKLICEGGNKNHPDLVILKESVRKKGDVVITRKVGVSGWRGHHRVLWDTVKFSLIGLS